MVNARTHVVTGSCENLHAPASHTPVHTCTTRKPRIAWFSYGTRIVRTVKGSDIETKPIVMKIKNDEKQKKSDLCPVIFYGSPFLLPVTPLP